MDETSMQILKEIVVLGPAIASFHILVIAPFYMRILFNDAKTLQSLLQSHSTQQ